MSTVKSRLLLTIIAVLPAIADVASAAEEGYSQDYKSCIDGAAGNIVTMMDCTVNETGRWDAKLNAAYKKAMGSLSKERQGQLRATQSLWIKFRDANCGFYLDPEGGEAAHLDADSCMLKMTAERATELERLP